jgi:uncharacterized OB-fold protein
LTDAANIHVSLGGHDSRWWHEALERGELLLPQCASCTQYRFPPMPSCPHCGAEGAGSPVPASGFGHVYSWVIIRMALDPQFASDVPYAIVAADLEEGPRVFGRFLGDEDVLAAGLPVRFVARETPDGATLAFAPTDD